MKLLLILSFQILFATIRNELKASDHGTEIITVSYNKLKYYCVIFSNGDSVSNDLKYFDKLGGFIQNVSDRVKESFYKKEAIKIYKNLEIIDLSKFNGYNEYEKKLYIFNNQLIHLRSGFIENIKVVNIIKGNNGNFIFSPDLKTEDNEWILKNRIKNYWDFDDGEIYCKMSLFGITDRISNEDLNFYKSKLIELRSPSNPSFYDFLNVLYKSKVIIIGFCDD